MTDRKCCNIRQQIKRIGQASVSSAQYVRLTVDGQIRSSEYDSSEGGTMVEIAISYEGSLRCRAVHEPSSTELLTDAPKDNMGQGASFSPTDLVATALGTCMLTIMGIVAQRMQVDLHGTTVRVHKEMSSSPPRRIARLTVEFSVPVPTTEEQRQKLQNAAATCPVHHSLHQDVAVAVKFNWSELATV